MSTAITIRRGTPDDHAAIVAMDPAARPNSDRVASLRAALAAGECLLAEAGGEVAGLVILNYGFFGFGFIPLILVAPAYRRRGVARRLLGEAQLRCTSRKLFTSANTSNKAAQALFAKTGFTRSGTIENLDEGDAEIVYYLGSGTA